MRSLSEKAKESLILIEKVSQQYHTSKLTTKDNETEKTLSEGSWLKSRFIRNFLSHLALSTLFILIGLLVGLLGYHWTNHLSWVDALVEASMILSGMGPINSLSTTSAKVFASVYALFSGLIFVMAMGIVLSPLVSSLLKQLSNFTDSESEEEKN
ncbi:hypothetical protein [Gloeothece verrucosa]|uniref:Ion transport 2 domain protein n=1 Tax=Gloeothece verrucosa (strain PCC 7822) TaxID=497965 RepID=E0UL66_GLOV7|nr:hypothetical protein [Gloeothece verrucosa]ADN17696.1 hypothetical protein Cyan7822_5842 [Gloeothece verrucosa PCC 7822]